MEEGGEGWADTQYQAQVQTTPFALKGRSQCQAVSNFSARAVRKLMLGPFHGSSGVHATTFPSLPRIYGDRLRFPAGGRERAARSGSTKAREEGLPLVPCCNNASRSTRATLRHSPYPCIRVCIFVLAYIRRSTTTDRAKHRKFAQTDAGYGRNSYRGRIAKRSTPHTFKFMPGARALPSFSSAPHFAPLCALITSALVCRLVSPSYDPPRPHGLRFRCFQARLVAAPFIFVNKNARSRSFPTYSRRSGCKI